MKQGRVARWGRLELTFVVALLLIGLGLTGAVAGGAGPAWASPSNITLKLIGSATDIPDQPNFQSNLDCVELTYRMASSPTMEAGCFINTAYGLFDPDTDRVIFNGSDEAVTLVPYSANQVLTPWLGTLDVLTLDATNTGGSLVGMYTSIDGHLQEQRNLLGDLVAKKLTAPPVVSLKDPSGKPLVINPQTMAFSADGSWLVVETLGGAFVRINLATLDMTAFAPAFGAQGSPALLKSQVSISSDGHYVAIENGAASSFKVYDLTTCNGDRLNLQQLSCVSYDYWSFVNAQISGLRVISHVRFLNSGIVSFNASDSSGTNSYALAPTAGIESLIDYLAIGDSYTSGEGAFDYLVGTDTAENACHLSVHAYPFLLREQLFSPNSGHSVACSGARIQDVLPDQPQNYRGQVAGGVPRSTRSADSVQRILADFTPGYLAQANFVSQYQPGVLTVSVGGDDIGFGEMIQNCVEPHISLHLSDSTCYDTYEDRVELKNLIDRTVKRWVALYKQLRSESPAGRLYVIGYPQIVTDTSNCALNVHLSKSELEFAQEVVSYLNGAIEQAASQAAVSYVDISDALNGHRLCEAASYSVAVNGLTAGKDGGPLGLRIFGKESYHPNAFGQSLIEAAILKRTHNLRDKLPPAVSVDNSSQNLLNVPKSGRPVNVLIPNSQLTNGVINRDAATTLSFDGSAAGLQSGASYTVRLDGATGPIVGTVSDQSGTVSGHINLPSSVPPGGHTIDITGPGQAGSPIDVSQPIFVVNSPADSDGDGLPDTTDSCPGAVNSGLDIDRDGIDDTCDNSVAPSDEGQVTSSPTASGNTAGGNPGQNGPTNNVEIADPVGGTTLSPTTTMVATFSTQAGQGSQVTGSGSGAASATVLTAKKIVSGQPEQIATGQQPVTTTSTPPSAGTFTDRRGNTIGFWIRWLILTVSGLVWLLLLWLLWYWRQRAMRRIHPRRLNLLATE